MMARDLTGLRNSHLQEHMMSTGNRQAAFNIEEKLAELQLTPSQRAQARNAMAIASGVVDILQALTGALKRLAEAIALKPSVRT
jgi:hypothetical protein